jgi:hypothetical protein
VRLALLATCVAAVGCAQTSYAPRVVARGELTLRYHHAAYEMWAGGRQVSRGLPWKGLEPYVACVEPAREHARQAREAGRAVLPLAIVGGSLGILSLGGFVGFADTSHEWQWLGGGIAVAGVGVALAATSRLLRNRANGNAVDAMNFYNDSVGALGATCADLSYPAPSGDAPPAGPPPTGPLWPTRAPP